LSVGGPRLILAAFERSQVEETLDADAIIRFWFVELNSADWFTKDPGLDRVIATRFGAVHAAAARCELYAWRTAPLGRLAEILVLDQFSRNIYRDRPESFAQDALALALAQTAIEAGAPAALRPPERAFLDMPFMHSESSSIHALAERLFGEPGLESNLAYEREHRAIIERFGRYPHRNHLLGRESTAADLAFLREPGSSF
jgi:uncharacterized protein (DUF924 family)